MVDIAGIAEVIAYHSPSARSGPERIFGKYIFDGVQEKLTAVLAIDLARIRSGQRIYA
jgi:hypothetical protein